MKSFIPLFLIGITLFLTACPYNSKFALSDINKSEIDTLLIGQWRGKNIKDSADMGEMNISKINNYEFLIELKSFNPSDSIERWKGYITKIGNQKIINLLGKQQNFIFIKYTTDGSSLKASIASDNFIQKDFLNQQELFDYFKENVNKKNLFESTMVFKKKIQKR